MLRRCLLLACAAACLSAQIAELGPAPRATAPLSSVTKSEAQFRSAAAWLDTSVRAAVAATWTGEIQGTTAVPTGFTGNVAAGIAGTTSQQHQEAVLTRVNWFRKMAGVPPVLMLDPALNHKAQLGALMLGANGQLSHNPPTTWVHYSADGATALSRSNVCYFFGHQDPGCIALYMQDHGVSNSAVGHRRWILFPKTTMMGTGDVIDATNRTWNALWVIQEDMWTKPRPATRDEFIAWPPPGYVPYQAVWPRWSFSLADANFGSATVTMTRNGVGVPVRLEPIAYGFGDDTIVWVPDNLDANTNPSEWGRPVQDTPVQVAIRNVMVNGVARDFLYTVTIFDPSTPPPPASSGSAPDFDGDGKPDVLWQHPATGELWAWFMNGTTRVGNAPVSGPTAWRVPATGDFNGDGKTDILWQHPATGELWVWFMNGTVRSGDAPLSGPTAWRVAATGDFNGDGKPDVLWQHPGTGELWVWFMNGAAWAGNAPVSGPTAWRVPATGDFNGDGKTDILWQHPGTGELWVWFMNGTTRVGNAPVSGPTAWRVPAAADFNGDGKTDILWQHPGTGELWVWFLNGTTWTGNAPISGPTAWRVPRLISGP
jgi:uncharacterized protein YkwD